MAIPGTDLKVIWTVEEAAPGSDLDQWLRGQQAAAVLAFIATSLAGRSDQELDRVAMLLIC